MSRHNITELTFLDDAEAISNALTGLGPVKAANVVALAGADLSPFEQVLEAVRASSQLYAQVNASSPHDSLMACRGRSGNPTLWDGELVVCVHAASEQNPLDEKVRAAARQEVDGVLLVKPDAWYANTPEEAGYCLQCAERFDSLLAEAMGEQYTSFDALDSLMDSDLQPPPFFGEHQRMQLSGGEEHGARLIRRARDEARSHRGVELGVGASVTGFNPVAVRLSRRLDLTIFPFSSPSPERLGIGAAEVFRMASGRRSAVALLDAEGAKKPGTVLQAARLAAAVGVDLALGADAPEESREALAEHRSTWRLGRVLPRPHDQLSEALLLYSPSCDHFTQGRHGRGVLEAAEALSNLGVQYRVILEAPQGGSLPLILVDADMLPEQDSRRIFRRINAGAGALVVGSCGSADEDGRVLMGPFPELRSGLNRVGDGTIFAFDPEGLPHSGSEREASALQSHLEAGLTSLWGRGRRALVVSGANVLVKTFVDPDRRLDIHLVGRDFDPEKASSLPVSGAVLILSGPAVGGAGAGRLLLPDGSEQRVPLIPFGMGFRVNLPEFPGAAVFTVSR